MSLIKIDNHVIEAQNRLIEQYKNKPRLNGLISAIVQPIQELEDTIFDILDSTWLGNANGFQLDRLGAIVGEARAGRSDDEYNNAIVVRILINSSGGEPDSIITAVKLLTGAKKIIYSEAYPANFNLFVQSNTVIPNLRQLVNSLAPAGVGEANVTFATVEPTNLFVFNETTSYIEDFVIDTYNTNGIDNEISGLVVIDDNNKPYRFVVEVEGVEETDGAGFAEVYTYPYIFQITDNDDVDYELVLDNGDILVLNTEDQNENYTISEFGGILTEAV